MRTHIPRDICPRRITSHEGEQRSMKGFDDNTLNTVLRASVWFRYVLCLEREKVGKTGWQIEIQKARKTKR